MITIQRAIWLAMGIVLVSAPEVATQVPLSAPSTLNQERQLAGHQITTAVVPTVFTRPKEPITWSSEVKVATEKVKVRQGESLSNLLMWRKINPDADAVSLVFDLNPELKSWKSLTPGQEITLPWVTTKDADVESALDKGQLIALVSDQEMKNELQVNAISFEELTNRTSEEKLRRSNYSETQIDAILNALRSTNESLQELRSANYPASKRVFVQLNADLKTALSWNFTAETSSEREKAVFIVTTMAENASDTTAALREGSSGRVPVEVITRRPNGEIVPNLQVLSAPALRETSPGDPFRKNSSPAKDDRPPAKYVIWATRDGEVVSAKKTIRVRLGDTEPIDLDIIR